MSEWHFREIKKGEIKRDPQEAEFFTDEGRPRALVREAIQNTIDAAEEFPIKVRLNFGVVDEEFEERAKSVFLNGLRSHLENQPFIDEAPFDEPLEFVAIEDFGTSGLVGDPNAYAESDVGEANHFYWFWRHVGRSGKEQMDLGRWGLGKTVYPTSSQILSYFGLTVRRDDARSLLMGLSVMKTHSVDGTEYDAYGYFSQLDDEQFPLPLEDDEVHDLFCDAFQLQRGAEPGLSVVVPYPKSELSPGEIRRAVVQEFFYPVLAEKLEIEVSSEGTVHTVDADGIFDQVLSIDWDEAGEDRQRVFKTIDFADEVRRTPDDEHIETECAGTDGAPRWSPELFSSDNLEELRDQWDNGELVAVRAPVMVKRKEGESSRSYLSIYLQADDELSLGESYFIRGGLIIPNAGKRLPAGVRGMVVIEDRDLVGLLGDAENPAHRDWSENSDNLKKKYIHGPFTLRFVNQSLEFLADQLRTPPEGLDKQLLEDIFFIERPKREEDKNRKGSDDPNPDPPSRTQPFKISRREGGFRIATNPEFDREIMGGIVRIAYDIATGNPFSKYEVWDFDLASDDFTIKIEGGSIRNAADNRIVFTVSQDEFELIVTGFDSNRDLIVDVTEKLVEEKNNA